MDATTKPFNMNEIEDGIEDIVQNAKEGKNLHDQFRPRPRDPSSIRREIDRMDSGSIQQRPENDSKAAQTTDELLADRGKTHGDYTDHAFVTQELKRVMRATKNWDLLSDIQKETLEMNAHKIGRILSGNPDHQDHWDDIAGYARLVSQRL